MPGGVQFQGRSEVGEESAVGGCWRIRRRVRAEKLGSRPAVQA
jgi:hypothetical protein